MGVVYRSFDPNIGRPVVLKTIRLDSAIPDVMNRYRAHRRSRPIPLSRPHLLGLKNSLIFIGIEVACKTLVQTASSLIRPANYAGA